MTGALRSSLLPDWAYAWGEPPARALLRASPEDFLVDEILGFEPDGEGDHAVLHVRKRNANTEWVAKRIAQLAGVRPVDVGYGGLKDRNAVTTQWFSVNLAGREEPHWSQLQDGEVEVLAAARHRRKIKRGTLKGNRFTLILRELEGEGSALIERLQTIAKEGVPNYFGEQRFGHSGNNVERARALLLEGRKERDRHKRGLYLSAARAYLFNQVLSARVADGSWNRPLPGDAMALEGTKRFFFTEAIDEEIAKRTAALDIHPTGPLWGRGSPQTSGKAREKELAILDPYRDWCEALEHQGLDADRRPLRLLAAGMEWSFPEKGVLRLSFQLPAGAYATTVLREVVQVRNVTADPPNGSD